MPMVTQQKRVSFLWILLTNLSWFVGLYTMFVLGTTLPFTMRRFTTDTRVMSLVSSVGLWFGIVLGPMVNYISDRIWTRFGRRRPFLLVATGGTLFSLFTIPFMPALAPLIMVVVISSILGDVGSTQEPLWLELIPPDQRGKGIAVRTMMTSMASILFFQIMFAQFKNEYHLGGLMLTGEQVCYLSAGVLQLGYLLLLAFGIREAKPEGVRLQHPGEIRSEQLLGAIEGAFATRAWWHYLLLSPLPTPWMLALAERTRQRWIMFLLFPSAFTVRFVRDVFCEGRWWWIYLFYITGNFLTSGGGFANLMLVDQFHYDVKNIAMTGWPMMIMANLLVTPFMGWFADKVPRIPVWLLAGLCVLAGSGLWFFMPLWAAVPKLELPPFWAMVVISLLGVVGMGSFMILCFQSLRLLAPQTNPRLWAWFLHLMNGLVMVITTFTVIRLSPDHTPSMTNWFLIMCIGAGMGVMWIVGGPLYYDFIPRDKIGNISAGCGLVSTTICALLNTFVGVWIFYFTRWTTGNLDPKAPQDYSSYLLMQATFGLVTLTLAILFVVRFVKGRMVEYGRLGLNSTDPVSAADPAPQQSGT